MIYKALPKSIYLVLCSKMRFNWGSHITFTSQIARPNRDRIGVLRARHADA